MKKTMDIFHLIHLITSCFSSNTHCNWLYVFAGWSVGRSVYLCIRSTDHNERRIYNIDGRHDVFIGNSCQTSILQQIPILAVFFPDVRSNYSAGRCTEFKDRWPDFIFHSRFSRRIKTNLNVMLVRVDPSRASLALFRPKRDFNWSFM